MLLTKIKTFNLEQFRQKIDRVCKIVSNYISPDVFIGNTVGPVITIPKTIIPNYYAEKFDLYGYTNLATPNYQIFTYSQEELDYDNVLFKIPM